MSEPRVRSPAGAAGFTLIELIVAVAVIALLAMIAVPSYRQHLLRAQRTDAKAALLRLQTNQERFYLTHNRFAATAELAALGFGSPALSEKGAYVLTVPVANAETYTAVATPTTGGAFDMTGDSDCTSFSLTAHGARSATGAADATRRCW